MPAPLLVAGVGVAARAVVGGAARVGSAAVRAGSTTARTSSRGIQRARIERSGTRAGVAENIAGKVATQEAMRTQRLSNEEESEDGARRADNSPYIQNARAIGSADPRYPTIAEEQQSRTKDYNSVKRTTNARLEARRQNGQPQVTNDNTAPTNNLQQQLARGIAKPGALAKKTKTVVTSTIKIGNVFVQISMYAIPLWFTIQLPFWILGTIGIGIEAGMLDTSDWLPLFGYVIDGVLKFAIPGYALFGASWVMNTVVGLITLGGSIILLTAFGVPWYKGKWSMIGLCGALVLYCAPMIQMFPWIYLFLFLVWISRVSEPA